MIKNGVGARFFTTYLAVISATFSPFSSFIFIYTVPLAVSAFKSIFPSPIYSLSETSSSYDFTMIKASSK
jgi:hypothetical protein